MNVLVLHGIEDKTRYPKAVVDLEFCLPEFIVEGSFLFHCYHDPFPERFKTFDYDGIILWSTFLDARHLHTTFELVKKEYDFITDSNAIKIALPQDEYYCNEVLDQWMVDWKVDYIYTVLYEFKELLLPRFNQAKPKNIKRGYTGYIFPSLINQTNHIKRFSERSIDVSYRASGTPTNLNRIANYKASIGDSFKKEFQKINLHLDISTDPKDFIYGEEWYSFIEDSKFVLGVNSGSSIKVPNQNVSNQIKAYNEEHPEASYDEIVKNFLSDQKEICYTAISPRNIEAALLGSCQITTDLGPYSGILEPKIHFIPINADCSNSLEVFEQMKDAPYVQRLINNTKEAMLSSQRLRIEFIIDELASLIKNRLNVSSHKKLVFQKMILNHRLFIYTLKSKRNWNQWRTHSELLKDIKRKTGYYFIKKQVLKRGS